MAVVQVGLVRVGVREQIVAVRVAVLAGDDHAVGVGVLVMLVVFVLVIVFEGLVRVLVLVTLVQVQPHADQHQRACNPEGTPKTGQRGTHQNRPMVSGGR